MLVDKIQKQLVAIEKICKWHFSTSMLGQGITYYTWTTHYTIVYNSLIKAKTSLRVVYP